ncbi:ethanolamine utilization protein [Urinicoccus massiliensis]|uniref:Ethanolamine utilization protein n=1 Tax=Urinicoccus massiliensis TaxID=1723382 RepID=A0A8H2M958_9FIRM|nr:hypothetical protein [Urinicoccus massiliensis]VFB17422.1 ethanolamine utilization protein [Urinicoccus massiliensis]
MDKEFIERITKKVLQKLKDQGLLYEKSILCLNFSQKQEKEVEEKYPNYDFHFSSVLQMSQDYDEIWIGRLSIQDLSQSALGLRSTVGNLVQEAAKGKKVLVFSSEHKTFQSKHPVPEALASMWEDYSQRLQAMGFVFNPETIPAAKAAKQEDSSQLVYLNKKLISQGAIAHLKGRSVTLVVPKKATITPLAVDFCKENRIEIKRESETEDASR